MTAHHTPGVDGPTPRDPSHAHAPERSLRPLKVAGLVGYGFLLAAIALVGVTLAAAAFDTALTPWIVATIVCGVIGIGFIATVRVALARHPARDRPQHDPLIPEVTKEEAVTYQREHHGRPDVSR
ncbi:hypothetical protein [Gordonia sp. (in: high G+C Gram-positive bacteria)]|uniref:hypothetical protein n=1 Tax=Gordonia sp. (in: high G+C Gram-positive bacteria) TaxID=84139 RepID=UPI0025BF5FDB|nr:hypothetical protein [Gordonia sp. (in: high G+C Gram-positive bacteria)]